MWSCAILSPLGTRLQPPQHLSGTALPLYISSATCFTVKIDTSPDPRFSEQGSSRQGRSPQPAGLQLCLGDIRTVLPRMGLTGTDPTITLWFSMCLAGVEHAGNIWRDAYPELFLVKRADSIGTSFFCTAMQACDIHCLARITLQECCERMIKPKTACSNSEQPMCLCNTFD